MRALVRRRKVSRNLSCSSFDSENKLDVIIRTDVHCSWGHTVKLCAPTLQLSYPIQTAMTSGSSVTLGIPSSIGHYQNERGAGSESIPQWRLGSFGGTGFERGQAKMPRQYNCCVAGCTNSHNCSVAAFLLCICTCLVPPNDPKCLCVRDCDPVFW